MKLLLLATVTVVGFTLTGCGGGGEGGSSSNPNSITPDTTSTAPQPLDQTPAPVTGNVETSADLKLTGEFALSSHFEVSVKIDISQLDNSSGYLSICPALETSSDGGDGSGPDYDNCFVRTALPDSIYDSNLDVSTAQGIAYSAIWFLDREREALITRHDLTTGAIRLLQ